MKPLIVLASFLSVCGLHAAANSTLTIEVVVEDKTLELSRANGRVIVALSSGSGRLSFTNAEPPGDPIFGKSVDSLQLGVPVRLDDRDISFPLNTQMSQLAPGEYRAQAVYMQNPDINLPMAPGNLKSDIVTLRIEEGKTMPPLKMLLNSVVQPRDIQWKGGYAYHEVPSQKLSAFHGRPMVIRLGVALPTGYDREQGAPYGLIIHIGGFGQRCFSALGLERDPRFVQILLDGAGPYGDPYYVNSENNGPYGDALVEEVIPYIEKMYRCRGTGQSRFTTGGSTGGWVSLALQIFYPDTFNGCWSSCPDGVDFRNFQLINVYNDSNAYVGATGNEQPAKRNRRGETAYTVRHETRLERVLGGGRWELGGQQWASWNAVYGPKGPNGPVPLWDGETGLINKQVVDHWRRYDLCHYLATNWKDLAPRLDGKMHVWVGDADEYFLNLAVERMKEMLASKSDPQFTGEIIIEPGKGHSRGWSPKVVRDKMAQRMEASSP